MPISSAVRRLASVQHFASDNTATVHPQILEAISRANTGHAIAYGDDDHTRAMERRFCEVFEADVRAFPVFNGTGANVTGLSAAVPSWGAVICTGMAHLNVDECGAPEKIGGFKLLGMPDVEGRLQPESIDRACSHLGFEHTSQPAAVSITQATEVGTLYTPAQISTIAERAHAHGLQLHVDGARIANACAALGFRPRELLVDTGVDIVSFGGTKNGMLMGEAVVFTNPENPAVARYRFHRKQAGQLNSKMRFVSAQFLAWFADDLWLQMAERANRLAALLADGLCALPGIEAAYPVQANGLFLKIPAGIVENLREAAYFYPWDETRGLYRLMVSHDQDEDAIHAFVSRARELVSQNGA